LLQASVDGLNIKPDGDVDVTFGGGGHSREILSRLGPNGKLFAFDRMRTLANALTDERFTLINEILDSSNDSCVLRLKSVDGILADLGVSSHQFDVAERFFYSI
jgi:16S rRNA (cytosine1402-N4)-methyltransferase